MISKYVLTKPNGYKQTVVYQRKKYISPEMIKEMVEMDDRKVKKKDICAKFNITLPTLRKYLKIGRPIPLPQEPIPQEPESNEIPEIEIQQPNLNN